MGLTRLFSTTTVEEQWQTVAAPWLREQAGAAWKDPRPTVVLTPSRAESFYLRSRLVQAGVPFLGLRFWTPSDARQFLLGQLTPSIGSATQAELRLVARACAEKLADGPGDADQATLSSVAQEPGPFLRAYDLLLGAGWNPARTGAAYGRALAQEMEGELARLGLATQAGLHRELRHLAFALKQESLIANLLIVGFNAAHWPLWDLLRAVVSTAERTVVSLLAPRDFAEEIDQLWISSWEEVTRTEAISPMGLSEEEPLAPFSSLVASYEQGAPGDASEADLTFLVSPDLASQARAVVLQALAYLSQDTCTRLGIVFPEANALALELAAQLRDLGIPLDDGTAAICPGLFERRAWQSWLALQEEASVQRLMAWLRACEAQGVSSGLAEISAREASELLENALGESLVDDLDYLSRHLEENSSARRAGLVADFLRQRLVLPKEATFAEFLNTTRRALAGPGWEDHLEQLKVDPPAWLRNERMTLSRRIFLGWLKESTDSREKVRDAAGNHFYGKVHLLIYAQMTGQTWSHLILTGLNEGVWPRVFEAEAFGSRHELEALNQQARGLNRLATEQGGQGEGHEVVRPEGGHCLLPLERQDLALRDLCSALEGTTQAASLTAMTTEAGRSLLPSDFFNYAYQAKTGRTLEDETFRALAHATHAWCLKHESLFRPTLPLDKFTRDLASTRIAYNARRDATQPFGAYEFSFAEPPARVIQLPCKEWEDAWRHPALVWLEQLVGVSPWPEGTLSWPRAVGTWVHRWLMTALRECRERNSVEAFSTLLLAATDREPRRVGDRACAVGIQLYPWWDHVCGQARSIALGLGESLLPHLPGQRFLSEFRLPADVMIALPGTKEADFALTGRIDLVLYQPEDLFANSEEGDFTDCRCWVIDFKTGSAQNLNLNKIGKGIGLQAVLYALAVQARGAGSTALSLHTRDVPLKRQVQLDDVVEMKDFFRSLDLLHRAGIFGMRGDAQNAYGYAPAYPMATRFVPADILEAKWALVHGNDSDEEGT